MIVIKMLNGRATSSLRRERIWARSGKHLLPILPFVQKREIRYLRLMLFSMLIQYAELLMLIIFMQKRRSRSSWIDAECCSWSRWHSL